MLGNEARVPLTEPEMLGNEALVPLNLHLEGKNAAFPGVCL